MSCRKNPSSSSEGSSSTSSGDSSSQPVSKKPKIAHEPSTMLPFTKTDFLQNEIHVGDKFVSVISYVDNISPSRTIKSKESNREFELFKFIINNNEGTRISRCAFNADVAALSAKIKLNQIILIQNATAIQGSSYNEGNVAFELQIKHVTEITDLGCFDILKTYGNVEKISLDRISQKTGHIKTEGYIRDQFVLHNKFKLNEYSGTITDGNFKLEVVISNITDAIKIDKGQKIQVVGAVQESENKTVSLKVQSIKQIKIIQGPLMSLGELILGGKILRRKPEGS